MIDHILDVVPELRETMMVEALRDELLIDSTFIDRLHTYCAFMRTSNAHDMLVIAVQICRAYEFDLTEYQKLWTLHHHIGRDIERRWVDALCLKEIYD